MTRRSHYEMRDVRTFGEHGTFTPIFDKVVAYFAADPLAGRKFGDRRRKRFKFSPLVAAAVYGRVFRRCDSGSADGRCYMGTRRIARELGISRSAAARCLEALSEAGFLIDVSAEHPERTAKTYRIPHGSNSADASHSETRESHWRTPLSHGETKDTRIGDKVMESSSNSNPPSEGVLDDDDGIQESSSLKGSTPKTDPLIKVLRKHGRGSRMASKVISGNYRMGFIEASDRIQEMGFGTPEEIDQILREHPPRVANDDRPWPSQIVDHLKQHRERQAEVADFWDQGKLEPRQRRAG